MDINRVKKYFKQRDSHFSYQQARNKPTTWRHRRTGCRYEGGVAKSAVVAGVERSIPEAEKVVTSLRSLKAPLDTWPSRPPRHQAFE